MQRYNQLRNHASRPRPFSAELKCFLRDGSQSAITESPPPASPKLPDALLSIETSVPGLPLNLILASSPTTTVL